MENYQLFLLVIVSTIVYYLIGCLLLKTDMFGLLAFDNWINGKIKIENSPKTPKTSEILETLETLETSKINIFFSILFVIFWCIVLIFMIVIVIISLIKVFFVKTFQWSIKENNN